MQNGLSSLHKAKPKCNIYNISLCCIVNKAVVALSSWRHLLSDVISNPLHILFPLALLFVSSQFICQNSTLSPSVVSLDTQVCNIKNSVFKVWAWNCSSCEINQDCASKSVGSLVNITLWICNNLLGLGSGAVVDAKGEVTSKSSPKKKPIGFLWLVSSTLRTNTAFSVQHSALLCAVLRERTALVLSLQVGLSSAASFRSSFFGTHFSQLNCIH